MTPIACLRSLAPGAAITVVVLVAGCRAAPTPDAQRAAERAPATGSVYHQAAMHQPALNTSGVEPGIHPSVVYGEIENPYTTGNASNATAAAVEGRRLFVQYNCAGCHGGRAGGGMGPSLRDEYWVYGNSDAQIYGTIVEGRSAGMPAWGGRIPEDQIWKLIAYIRTLATPQEPDPPPPQENPPLEPSPSLAVAGH